MLLGSLNCCPLKTCNSHPQMDSKGVKVKSDVVRTLSIVAGILVAFGALAGALYYERTQEHKKYIADRPPIPTEYHAYVPEDTVISDVLDNPDLGTGARVETSKYGLMVPVGYGGDTPLPSTPCTAVPKGYYTELGVYDERADDGVVDGVIAVYTAPSDYELKPGDCQSELVFMVKPEFQMFE